MKVRTAFVYKLYILTLVQEERMHNHHWYKLDNMGKFYSSISNRKTPAVFRYSTTITEEIDEKVLQDALDETVEMFPNFNVNLRKGIFWYYLESTNKKFKVTEENLPICFKLYNNSENFLFRVNHYRNRINFEVSHIISDGVGSLNFFKTLVYNYLRLKYSLENITIEYDASHYEKTENSFDKYYKKIKIKPNFKKKIYKFESKKLNNEIRFMELHLSANEVLELSHSYNATLTSLLIAVLIYSIRDEIKLEDLKKTIKINVPVDLRKYFKSITSMNFFGLISVLYQFKSKDDKFSEIINSVSEQLKINTTHENLSVRMNEMISLEKNVIARCLPIFLKNIILNYSDKVANRGSTSTISNIGLIKVAPDLEEYIKEINILTSTNGFQFTVCSYKNDLSIGISSVYVNNNIIKNFCRFFTSNNITAYMNINEEDSNEKM